jgi:hypothetical protein
VCVKRARVCNAPGASSAGFAALLTFPGLGFFERSPLATRGGPLDKVVAGIDPATIATLVRLIS